MAISDADRARAYRERKKAGIRLRPANMERKAKIAAINTSAKHAEFEALIEKARQMAQEINQEILADLKAKPLSRENARLMDQFESAMRVSFPQIYAR